VPARDHHQRHGCRPGLSRPRQRRLGGPGPGPAGPGEAASQTLASGHISGQDWIIKVRFGTGGDCYEFDAPSSLGSAQMGACGPVSTPDGPETIMALPIGFAYPGVGGARGYAVQVSPDTARLKAVLSDGSVTLAAPRVVDGRKYAAFIVPSPLRLSRLTRLLRSLESDELVRVEPSKTDGRVRRARLTSRGRTEKAELDRLSDVAAAALLEPLSTRQRDRLMTAMAEVERLLVASAIQIGACDPRDPDARRAVRAYVTELADRFEGGFDPAFSISATEAEMSPPAGLFLLATLHGEPVGCGALKFHPGAPVEVKRMWVDRSVRGLGLGGRLLAELEAQAAAYGVRTLRLETNRSLDEAIGLYRKAGYREVPAFNDEPYAHHWFEKTLEG
jgi:GNAT superfamily N-acetyltransferase